MDVLHEKHVPWFVDDVIINAPHSGEITIEYKTGIMSPRVNQMVFAKTPEGIALMASHLLALHARSLDDSVSDRPIVYDTRVK